MKPYEKKAYEVGKNGGTVPTKGLSDPIKKAIDAAVNAGKKAN